MENTIEIKNVTKKFGDFTAVNDLTLNVPKGSIYGFIGPNGSGKTTTLRMLMNIIYQDSGDIHIFGEKYKQSFKDRIGYLPEERGLYKSMKVRELLHFFGKLKNGKNILAEADKWLKKLDLYNWRDEKVETLSKGMGQKIQFIASVVTSPELIILDEPFSGLDPVNRDVMKDAVLELKESGKTVIFSTHDMDIAEKMCDYVFMIYKGKKVLDGTLDSIKNNYGTDIIKIMSEGGLQVLKEVQNEIKGIENINDFGHIQEIRIEKTCNPQNILRSLIEKTAVSRFEISQPSLHDIFVRIAKPVVENDGEVKNAG
ncbi:MAG: ATP-binding cassette domain-containing protein [Candidatus Delongbacteria bacterium]|nr:ATP-binding cassette domain-containing protein [Candidatus Delongbacteria bacterium]